MKTYYIVQDKRSLNNVKNLIYNIETLTEDITTAKKFKTIEAIEKYFKCFGWYVFLNMYQAIKITIDGKNLINYEVITL